MGVGVRGRWKDILGEETVWAKARNDWHAHLGQRLVGKEAGEVLSCWVTESCLGSVKEVAFNFVGSRKILNGCQQWRDTTLCFMYVIGFPLPLLMFNAFISSAQHKKFIHF